MLTSYNAKCRKILLLNEKKMKKYKYNVLPDWIVLNLQTAVKKIILLACVPFDIGLTILSI